MIDSTNPRILADNIRAQNSDISTLQTTVTNQGDAIEALRSFSTDEIDTGIKLGDDPIYRKVFVIEEMPNTTTLNINHGISNLKYALALYGATKPVPGTAGLPMPYANSLLLRYNYEVIVVQATSNLSNTSGIVVFEYAKSGPTSLTTPAPDDTRSIEPEEREEKPIIDEPIEKPVVEVKKTTRKKSTTTE